MYAYTIGKDACQIMAKNRAVEPLSFLEYLLPSISHNFNPQTLADLASTGYQAHLASVNEKKADHSAQKEKYFKNDRYQDMLPVRQLWIFPDRYQENGLIRFTFQAEEIIKTYPEGLCERLNDRCHYMIQSCFAFLSDDSYHNDENNVLKMLGELFCNPDRTEAIDYLRKEGLKMETQLVTAVEDYNEMKCYSKREYGDLSNENQGLSKELNFAKKQAQRQQLICQKAQEQHYPLGFALLFSDDSYLEEMERKFQI